MSGDPLFSLQKSSSLLNPQIFRKIKKFWPWELYIFQLFDSKRGKFMPFATGYNKQFSLQNVIFTKWNETSYKYMYLLNRLLKVNRNQKCFLRSLTFIIFNTWSSKLSHFESTVVFCTGYVENKRCDPPIFLPLWPELVIT